MEVKQKIINTCFSLSGKQILHEKYIDDVIKEEIYNYTLFLPFNTHYKKRVHYILNGWDDIRKCPICDKPILEKNLESPYGDMHITCSPKCAGKLSFNTGYEKRINTNNQKYSGDTPFHSKEVQEKIEVSNLMKHGVKNVSQRNSIKNKKRYKHNTKSIYELKSIYEKVRNTAIQNESHISKEVYDKLSSKEWMEEIYKVKNIIEISQDLDIAFSTVNNWMIRHDIPRDNWNECRISKDEIEIASFIDSIYDGNTIRGDRNTIKPLELDVYIPELNIAIEFNGLYWHSESIGKDRSYHLNKTKRCEEQGIQLFHILDSEWATKKEIWKSVLSDSLGLHKKKIGARQAIIKTITLKESMDFCNENHLQGQSFSSINYGLVYDNEIVSVMTFSRSRFSKNYKYELQRFCSKKGYQIHGGASKLLKHFRKNHIGSIVSYANRRWSIGNLYEKLGFTFLHDAEPNYFYFKNAGRAENYILESRNKYQKHKLKDKLDVFDENLSEYQNMLNNGYDRIWDSGNKVYYLNV